MSATTAMLVLAAHAKVPVLVAGGRKLPGREGMREMLATTAPGTVVLDPQEVGALAWRPFAGVPGVRDRVLWEDPAGKSCAGLLHLDPDASVLAHIHPRAVHHLWVVSGSCAIDGKLLDAGAYGFVPAGREHGIEQVGRAGCLLFYVYLHQGATRQAAAPSHRGVAPSTAEERAWVAAAQMTRRVRRGGPRAPAAR